jgi:hypothetical protein
MSVENDKHGTEEKCIQCLVINMKVIDHFENHIMNGGIILNWILNK